MDTVEINTMLTKDQLLRLADAFARHTNRADATISNKIVGHARLIARLRDGFGCTLATASRAHNWFSENWPPDLEWPRDVPRPNRSKEAA